MATKTISGDGFTTIPASPTTKKLSPAMSIIDPHTESIGGLNGGKVIFQKLQSIHSSKGQLPKIKVLTWKVFGTNVCPKQLKSKFWNTALWD